jgi:hypothetical protein
MQRDVAAEPKPSPTSSSSSPELEPGAGNVHATDASATSPMILTRCR